MRTSRKGSGAFLTYTIPDNRYVGYPDGMRHDFLVTSLCIFGPRPQKNQYPFRKQIFTPKMQILRVLEQYLVPIVNYPNRQLSPVGFMP